MTLGGGHLSSAKPAADEIFEHAVGPYRITLPILFTIAAYVSLKKALFKKFGRVPRTNFVLFDRISVTGRRVKENAARWPALDACYNFVDGQGSNAVVRAIDSFWMRVRNAQAVRNRFKIAKCGLSTAIKSLDRRGNSPVRILCLASGSAQAVIETVSELKAQGISIELLLVDSDTSALEYARALSRKHDIEKLVTVKEGDVLFFDRIIIGFRPDIIEMMGMIDYLRDTTTILLIRKIRRCLKVGGYFFTCHIHPNIEAYFLRHVVNWEMTYRSRDALCALIEKGGFSSYRLFTEPHGIHSVAVARKIAGRSLSELMRDACGMIDSGIPDLASNPKHLEGFGRDSMGR